MPHEHEEHKENHEHGHAHDNHGHEHGHGGHGHHHSNIKNIKLAAIINISFTVFEIIGGVLTNSLAIIADSFHDLGDSVVLISAWRLEKIAEKKPDWKRSFGYRRLSLLSALLNAAVLLGGTAVALFQAFGRLAIPQPVNAGGMIFMAFVGITANLVGSLRLRGGKTVNEKVLSWHLLEDVFGWVAILISATIIKFTDFYILDPIFTIGFSVFILYGLWRNSRELFNIFLEGVPTDASLSALIREIDDIEGVSNIYDAHLWSLDGGKNYFSMKAVASLKDEQKVREEIHKILPKYGIVHSTIELKSRQDFSKDEKEQEFLK